MKNKTYWILLCIVAVFFIGILLGYLAGRPSKADQTAETTEETTEQSLYTSYVTLYVHNQALSGDNISSSDLSAGTELRETYITIFQSKTIQEKISKAVKDAYPDAEYTLSLDKYKDILLKLSVTGENPEYLAEICNIAIDIFQESVSNIVEGSSLKIIDRPTNPEIAD